MKIRDFVETLSHFDQEMEICKYDSVELTAIPLNVFEDKYVTKDMFFACEWKPGVWSACLRIYPIEDLKKVMVVS